MDVANAVRSGLPPRGRRGRGGAHERRTFSPLREDRALRRYAGREDDHRRRGAHERRARAPLRDDPRRVRDSARRLRRHDRGNLPRRQDARARRAVGRPGRDALRRAAHDALRLKQSITLPGPLGVRRPLARRTDPVRDPVPRHGAEPALQRPRGQPRHRQAGRRCARRQARAGRGDERLALGARPERERRLGIHVLREAERDRLRPRARHRHAGARSASTCRGGRTSQALSAVRLSLADGGRRLELAKRGGNRSRSSTPRPSR